MYRARLMARAAGRSGVSLLPRILRTWSGRVVQRHERGVRRVFGWQSLRGQCGHALRVHLLGRVLLACICGLRFHNLRNYRAVVHSLRGGQLVRGGRGPVRDLHVCGGVRLDERDGERVCGDDGDVRAVRGRLLLRRRRPAALTVHLYGGVRLDGRGFCVGVLGDHGDVSEVCRWIRLRWRRCATCRVRLQRWLLVSYILWERVHDVCGRRTVLHCVCGGELVRWQRGPARCVHVRGGLLLRIRRHHDVQWDGRGVRALHHRLFVRRGLLDARGVHVRGRELLPIGWHHRGAGGRSVHRGQVLRRESRRCGVVQLRVGQFLHRWLVERERGAVPSRLLLPRGTTVAGVRSADRCAALLRMD